MSSSHIREQLSFKVFNIGTLGSSGNRRSGFAAASGSNETCNSGRLQSGVFPKERTVEYRLSFKHSRLFAANNTTICTLFSQLQRLPKLSNASGQRCRWSSRQRLSRTCLWNCAACTPSLGGCKAIAWSSNLFLQLQLVFLFVRYWFIALGSTHDFFLEPST